MPEQNRWTVVLYRQAPYISKFLFMSVTRLSRRFLSIVSHSSIHILQVGLVNYFIAAIGLSFVTTLNVIHLCKSVRGLVYLKCCSKWAANESYFCPFFEKTLDIR